MLKNIFNFTETETTFDSNGINLKDIEFDNLRLLVKAHEKEIYEFGEDKIIARPHRDNDGFYPFSKMDFLSHKLQELIYPGNVPKVYAACFENEDRPFYILEKVEIDDLHKAYNVSRQKVHQKEGLSYKFDKNFLEVDENKVREYAQMHFDKVEKIQKEFENNLSEYGITFDHSQVNITWRDEVPIALELHKCQREYLFNFDRCESYFLGLKDIDLNKEKGLEILRRIKELSKKTPKEI